MTYQILESVFVLQVAAVVAAVLIYLENPAKLKRLGLRIANFADGLIWLRASIVSLVADYRAAWSENMRRIEREHAAERM